MLVTLPVVVHRRLRWADLGELPSLAAGWFAEFALPLFRWVPEPDADPRRPPRLGLLDSYRALLAEQGVDLELRPSSGAEENLQRLRTG